MEIEYKQKNFTIWLSDYFGKKNISVKIIDNHRLSEKEIGMVTECLKRDDTGKEAYKYLGKLEDADTGQMVSVYSDKNGCLMV